MYCGSPSSLHSQYQFPSPSSSTCHCHMCWNNSVNNTIHNIYNNVIAIDLKSVVSAAHLHNFLLYITQVQKTSFNMLQLPQISIPRKYLNRSLLKTCYCSICLRSSAVHSMTIKIVGYVELALQVFNNWHHITSVYIYLYYLVGKLFL